MSGNKNSGMRPPSRWEPCGTAAAYRRHVRRKEPSDQACKDAHAVYAREHYVPAGPRLTVVGAGQSRATTARNRQRRAERLEDYAFLRDCGTPRDAAAARVGIRHKPTVREYERAYQDGKTRQRRAAA